MSETQDRQGPQIEQKKSPEPEDENLYSLFDHLDELRRRLIVSAYAWILFSFLCYFFSDEIIYFLKEPLMKALPATKQQLYFTNPFENFLVHIKVSAFSGLFFTSPFIIFQIWKFIAPGLYLKEKKIVGPFIISSTIFFLSGVLFTYFYIFPSAFKFLIYFGDPSQTTPMITMSEYFGTIIKILLGFGMAFELPVILVLLGYMKVISAKLLREQRRWAIMAIAILCAFFSPPDLMSMVLMMVPLYLFFEASVIIISVIEKRRKD